MYCVDIYLHDGTCLYFEGLKFVDVIVLSARYDNKYSQFIISYDDI